MDVQNGSIYPVFDVLKGTGEDGEFTYPDDADDPYGDGPPKNRWTVDRDGVLRRDRPATCTPAACSTDLWVRAGRARPAPGRDRRRTGAPDTAHLFTSDGEVLRARRRGVVGRVDDVHAGRLAGRR